MTKKQEPIYVGIDNEVIELKGTELEAFIADREARAEKAYLIEAEQMAKKEIQKSALNKLKSLGLTESEAKIIIGLE